MKLANYYASLCWKVMGELQTLNTLKQPLHLSITEADGHEKKTYIALYQYALITTT